MLHLCKNGTWRYTALNSLIYVHHFATSQCFVSRLIIIWPLCTWWWISNKVIDTM